MLNVTYWVYDNGIVVQLRRDGYPGFTSWFCRDWRDAMKNDWLPSVRIAVHAASGIFLPR